MNIRKSTFKRLIPAHLRQTSRDAASDGSHTPLSVSPYSVTPQSKLSGSLTTPGSSSVTDTATTSTIVNRTRYSSDKSSEWQYALGLEYGAQRGTTKLFTGSTYKGTWNQFGFNGLGTYHFPDGVEYDGQFRNGHFHGNGQLTFPNGIVITGIWRNGHSTQLQLQFADGLLFSETDWNYCREGFDRRFATDEYRHLAPVGEHQRLPRRMNVPVPTGCYNTGEGFYNPRTKCLYSLTKTDQILRIPTEAEEKWILANCPLGVDTMSDVRDEPALEEVDYSQMDEEIFYK